MSQRRIPAVFMRGGTSKALVFKASDLPADRADWDPLFLAALGSPDAYGRQLDGMGGGISSLSKVCVIGPPSRPDADVDYTFAQVAVDSAAVEYGSICGNMSSAIGPFAVDEGLVAAGDGEVTVRIHNTNTGKLILSRFTVENGRARTAGRCVIPGVSGTGAAIALAFTDPAGIYGRGVLPTGRRQEVLDISGGVRVSMIDSAAACIFVAAEDLGLTGSEAPDLLEADRETLSLLEQVRQAGSLAMGVASDAAAARATGSTPKVALVGAPSSYSMLSGEQVGADTYDLAIRMISMGRPHRAVPLTGGLCAATGAAIAGTLLADAVTAKPDQGYSRIRIGTPSGVIHFGANVTDDGDMPIVHEAIVERTARRLMEGTVVIPEN